MSVRKRKTAPTHWGDIPTGIRGDSEMRPVRSSSDAWWQETAEMVHRGYRRFWRKRGKTPPTVSKERLETNYTPMPFGEGK